MEDDVYICKWKRTADGFRLWVKGKPKLGVEGDGDIYALSERLSEVIAESGGAPHAVVEFDKPFPKSAFDSRYSTPAVVTVCGDDSFEATLSLEHRRDRALWYDQFFQQPSCPECKGITSERNDVPITIDDFRPSFDGGFITCGTTALYVYSDAFLDLLTPEEKSGLQLRPVTLSKKSKKQYFELVGPQGIPYTAVSTLDHSGWRCDFCGFSTFGYLSRKSAIRRFVRKSKLPNPLPSVFTVGTLPRIRLCLTAERWAEMVSKPGTRGFTSSTLGIAPDMDVVVRPELQTR